MSHIVKCLAVPLALFLSHIAHAATPQNRYQHEIDHELFDTFGHGSHGRNLYCAGPAVIGFQILPDGHVRHVKLLRQSLPGLDARLVASISNLVFPRFPPGMAQRPYPATYRYGVWPLARPFIEARSNCR